MMGLFVNADQSIAIEKVAEPIEYGGTYRRWIRLDGDKLSDDPKSWEKIAVMPIMEMVRYYEHVEIHGGCNGYELFLEVKR